MKIYAVTGTFHGSIIYSNSEGEARKIFHKFYNGESIIHIKKLDYYY
jgi:CheY-specific phosphatase CheX